MKLVKIHNDTVVYRMGTEIFTVPLTPMAKQILNYYNRLQANN